MRELHHCGDVSSKQVDLTYNNKMFKEESDEVAWAEAKPVEACKYRHSVCEQAEDPKED